MSPTVTAAAGYLLRYGPRAWRRLRVWNRERRRTVRSFLAAVADAISEVEDVAASAGGDVAKEMVWASLQMSWWDVVRELSPAERNLVNEVLLQAVKATKGVP